VKIYIGLVAIPASLLLLSVPASASEPLPDATPRVLYEASEGSGTTAVDSSTFGNHGTLKGRVGRADGAYLFPPVGANGQHHRITAAPDRSLSPGTRAFAVGADVLVSPTAVWEHHEMALIRNGDSKTAGGDYKLELVQTAGGTVVALCVIHDGTGGSGSVRGNGRLATIADGVWHNIACSRDPATHTVSLTIDGFTVARADNELGSIVGDQPLLLGAQPKKFQPGLREQFNGRMDNIRFAVSR